MFKKISKKNKTMLRPRSSRSMTRSGVGVADHAPTAGGGGWMERAGARQWSPPWTRPAPPPGPLVHHRRVRRRPVERALWRRGARGGRPRRPAGQHRRARRPRRDVPPRVRRLGVRRLDGAAAMGEGAAALGEGWGRRGTGRGTRGTGWVRD
jgi:hypothetical protein